jgi:hypothetical protein
MPPSVPTVYGAAAPLFSHHRRTTPPTEVNRNTMFTREGYEWSVNNKNKHLGPRFLYKVLEKIQEAASELLLLLHADDISWLTLHEGRFQRFLATNCSEYQGYKKQARFANKDAVFIHTFLLDKNHIQIGASPRYEGSTYSPTYRQNLEDEFRQLWNFFAIIGDYTSMLILLPHPPSGCPSMNDQSLKNYILHKYNPPLQPLTTDWEQEGVPVKDIHNRPILSQGTVQNYLSMDTIIAGVVKIHSKYAKLGSLHHYNQQCIGTNSCLAKFKQGGAGRCSPCLAHDLEVSHYLPSGCPKYSDTFKNLEQWLVKENVKRGYKPTSKDAFLPSDILEIQAHIASTQYKLPDLMRYTMLLGAIYAARRYDGYSETQFEDFNKLSNLCEVQGDWITNMAQKVREKRDNCWYYYLLYFNDIVPQRCYLRHLLVYVHVANLTGGEHGTGFLYTNPASIENGGDHTQPLLLEEEPSYEDIHKWFQELVDTCISHSHGMKISVHSPRSTFYLFWVLGGGNLHDGMRNARHVNEQNAMKYYRSSKAILQFLNNHVALQHAQRISPAIEVMAHQEGKDLERLNQMVGGARANFSLEEASKLFVEKMLGVSPNSSLYRNPAHLLGKAYRMNFNRQSQERQLQMQLNSIPEPFGNQVTGWVNAYLGYMESNRNAKFEARMKELESRHHGFSPGFTNTNGNGNMLVAHSQGSHRPPIVTSEFLEYKPDSGKYVIRPGSLHARLKGGTKTRQHYEIIQDIISLYPTASMTPGSNNTDWERYRGGRKRLAPSQAPTFSKYLERIAGCMIKCHKNDLATFMQKYPTYVNARFTCKCDSTN